MDVFLMIRRHKTTIFLDAKENNTVFELKKMIEGILKHKPEDQQLFKDEEVNVLLLLTFSMQKKMIICFRQKHQNI